jgi:isopentenyl-diphosphate delta-isomerase
LIQNRKEDHVNICLNEDVKGHYNFWDDIQFVHEALPEMDFSDIETRTEVLGKKLGAPIIISAITGGYPQAESINRNLAEAASSLRIGMGVGSQRAALENPELERTYSVIKDFDIPLVIGNVGAPQLISQNGEAALDSMKIEKAFEMIDADILAVHLNFLQEVVMPEGEINAKGCFDSIRNLARDYPILVKETGCGISRKSAMALKKSGVLGIDVGGSGGTSWSAVEVFRAAKGENDLKEKIGKTFWDWGIPTPVSVVESNVGLDIIATGGVRSGLDVGRALVLGANAAGMARQVLKAAVSDPEKVMELVTGIIHELKVTMFLTQSKNISDLKDNEVIILGRTKEWMEQLSD